jgi:hypothetical protein
MCSIIALRQLRAIRREPLGDLFAADEAAAGETPTNLDEVEESE